ncbi:hypothetical protein ACQEU8_13685 [Streptomyces sp. CA-250714]|uniref:hypothetical protein n=1 Tax=Streptomyces sp. CA-250714 TaxID=3240060 RepID=UPI003D8A6FF8
MQGNTVHTPGRPEDLPRPERLWQYGVLGTLVAAATGEPCAERFEYPWWVFREPDELGWDDSGGQWWILRPLPEGRAVLFGVDHELSDTRNPYAPPTDLFDGAPDWLPLAELQDMDDMLGYLYWWDGAGWHRAPYPEGLKDDGLETTVGKFITEELAVDEAACTFTEGLGPVEATLPVTRGLLGLVEQRGVTEAAVRELLDALPTSEDDEGEIEPPEGGWDLAALLDVAHRARVTPA